MKIKELFSSQRPREKALEIGVENLSVVELLAIIIRNGRKGRNALDLAHDVLHLGGGSLCRLNQMTLRQLTEIQGIGREKAIGILSALELGRRMLVEYSSSLSSPYISSPEDVFRIFDPLLRFKESEECHVLLMDSSHKVISRQEISAGGFSQTGADIRKICNRAVAEKAAAVILVHNHPTGLARPSENDRKVTDAVEAALKTLDIRLCDHVICGNNEYYSFSQGQIFRVKLS